MPSMTARGGGRIINIASVAGKVGVPLRTAYCGAKHALIGFFDALRLEEHARGTGVRVSNVCPGSVRTSIAVNAAMGDGSKRGQTDANIEAGLDVAWVADRILAAADCGVDESWIAGGLELLLLYVGQYAPGLLKRMLMKKAVSIIQATQAPVASAGKEE